MPDLFDTHEKLDTDPVILNGKCYTLHPAVVDKQPAWTIRWRSLDQTRTGCVGGYHGSPELARVAIEKASKAFA